MGFRNLPSHTSKIAPENSRRRFLETGPTVTRSVFTRVESAQIYPFPFCLHQLRHLCTTINNQWSSLSSLRGDRQRTLEKCLAYHSLVEQAREWCSEGAVVISQLEEPKMSCVTVEEASALLQQLNEQFTRTQGEQKVCKDILRS